MATSGADAPDGGLTTTGADAPGGCTAVSTTAPDGADGWTIAPDGAGGCTEAPDGAGGVEMLTVAG